MSKVVTVRVPLLLLEAAGHVFHVLGASPVVNTFDYAPRMVDSDNIEYGVTSGLWSDSQINGVKNPMILLAPHLQHYFTDYSPSGLADRKLCEEAQASFRVWDGVSSKPSNNFIVAVVGIDGKEALSLMDLRYNEKEDI